MTDDEKQRKVTLDNAMHGLRVRLSLMNNQSPVPRSKQRDAALGLLLYHVAMLSRETQLTVRDRQLLQTAAVFGALWRERQAEIIQMIPIFRETDPDLH